MPDRRFEDISRYTIAKMMGFMPERRVMATGGRFVKFWDIDNSCWALLADQMGSFGMAAGFGKLSKQKAQTFKKSLNEPKMPKIL